MDAHEHLVKHFFPSGFRLMVVDVDLVSLKKAGDMISSCNYKATLCGNPKAALSILREHPRDFDLILAEVHMTEMDGFELLQIVISELNIPVVLMSARNDMKMKMNAIIKGASSFFDKPLEMVLVRSMWKNAAWENLANEKKILMQAQEDHQKKAPVSSNNNKKNDNEKGDQEDNNEERSGKKRRRLIWTPDLEKKFQNAVSQLGPDAVPAKIAQIMNVEGVERHHVASHLQKDRIRKQKQGLVTKTSKRRSKLLPSYMFKKKSQSQTLPRPHESQQHYNAPLNSFANLNPCPPETMPQYSPYQPQPILDNSFISYNPIPTINNVERSMNQLGFNENVQTQTYPQLQLQEQFAPFSDVNQMPPQMNDIAEGQQINVLNDDDDGIYGSLSNLDLETQEILREFTIEEQPAVDDGELVFDTSLFFSDELGLADNDLIGDAANNDILSMNQMVGENAIPQLQFSEEFTGSNYEEASLYLQGIAPLNPNQFQNFSDHDQQQDVDIVNGVGGSSNGGASVTFTELLNRVLNEDEDIDIIDKSFFL
ncbi:hypothetical protein J5N97_009129 [Dioscorea zingiberensis]|uniref:Uncharacterized protein n=1 Tax=Dioscorea zingiberensis TaxID=325984 RepID=A0A9D5CXF7_9LILI|nr:hypothetical protein J5N97_009129 [Dioscorea zingiberensis]